MSRRSLFLAATAAAAVLSCGGGGDAGPTPLRHHFDDMHIAAVPMGEKQAVIESQNDYSVAKMERAKAEADYTESATKLEVAQNERSQALLEEKSARSEKKAADATSDLNRVNNAAGALRSAELARRAADEKVSWLKQRRVWLRRHLRYTEEDMYAKEAAYEAAKARVAKSNKIQPRGVVFENFDRQAKERAARVQKARAAADRDRTRTIERKQKWEAMVREANRAKGVGSAGGAGGATP